MPKRKHDEIADESLDAAPPVDNFEFRKSTPEEIKGRV